MHHIADAWQRFERNQLFSDADAWLLFRLGAFGEAIGWTLLITGIAIEHFSGYHGAVVIAGRMHGTLFILYAVAGAGLYPNLKWPRWKALLAVGASVPPYGSLVFERWAAYQRRNYQARVFCGFSSYLLLRA